MPDTNNIGLDTTIIIRLIMGKPEAQFNKVQDFLKQSIINKLKLFVSDTVLIETYHVLQHHFDIPKKEIINQLDNMLSSGVINCLPNSVLPKILREGNDHKAGLVDQIIHSQYELNNLKTVSFDKALKKLTNTIIL